MLNGRWTSVPATLALFASTAWGAVSGRVVSSEGKPLADATVNAYAQETYETYLGRLVAGRSRSPLASARPGADGSFRLEIPGAVVDVEARAVGFAPAFQAAVSGEAVTITLRPARSRRGVVTAKGSAVANAIVVWVAAGAAAGDVIVRSGPDGSYEIPDPDVWADRLAILHSDFAPFGASSEGPTWPAALAHELDPGTSIQGTVMEGGRPVQGATMRVDGWPLGTSTEGGAFLIRHAAANWSSVVAATRALAGAARRAPGALVVHVRPAGTLSGVVRDATTRQPLAGAVVTLQSDAPETATAVSDAQGRYVFPALLAARHTAWVVRAGYMPFVDSGPEPTTVDLRRSPSLQRDFALGPLRRIAGRVQDNDRKPVENALVILVPEGFPTVHGTGELSVAGTRTGADGAFALALPGEISAPNASFKGALLALKEGFAAGRLDLGKAPAPERPVVTLATGVEMRGRVLSVEGSPISGVAVTVAEDASGHGFSLPVDLFLSRLGDEGWTRSDAEGRFALRVHPTVHHLGFRKSGYATKVVRDRDASSEGSVDVVLEAAAEIRGVVVRTDGSGVAGVSIHVTGWQVSLTATTEADGSFVIGDLGPGTYQLHALLAATGVPLERSVVAPASDVRIEIGPAGTVRGHVIEARSRQPLSSFWVVITPADSTSRTPLREEVNDAGGAFAVGDVPAGGVTVTVGAEGHVARTIEDVAVLAGAETPDLEVALDSGATIVGRVTAESGEGLADVAVAVVLEGAEGDSAQSNENGDYELSGVVPGKVKLGFRRQGFITAWRTVDVAATARVDVTLARGVSVSGVVVSEGLGVPRAGVQASSGAAGTDPQWTRANDSGRFTLGGLSPGRYTITAHDEDKGQATLEDVDVEKAGSLRLVLERRKTAVLTGRVVGLPAGDDVAVRMVMAWNEEGHSQQAPVAATGAFRLEGAPTGSVKAAANVTWMSGRMRSSRVTELTVAPDSEQETVIEFRGEAVITGTVTRAGAPVTSATVWFTRAEGEGETSMATTDAGGQYVAGGLDLGPHRVSVMGTSFQTDYVVTGSGQLDLDVTGATLTGRAVDAASGAPIAGVEVSFWRLGGRENAPATSATTGANGAFAVSSLREGRYRVLTAKSGYGQQAREVEAFAGQTAEILFELTAAEGLSVRVVDARDERPLAATVVVRDMAKQIVANRHSGVEADGTLTIALASGPYLLSTSATGYGTTTIPVASPGSGIRVGLTPGGTLVVESDRDLRGRIRLVQPDGEEYVRCWCNGIADIEVKGRRTTVPNITPGSYTLEVVDGLGAASGGGTVVIREGQASTVHIE